jgi:DNA-binding transcriptional MocR family regulator
VRDLNVPPGYGQLPDAPRQGLIDLAFNYPYTPSQADEMRLALRALAASGDLSNLVNAQPTVGREAERRLVASHLGVRGVQAQPADLLIVNGAQQGLALAVLALLRPGDVVAVDALTYPGFIALAQTHRLDLAPIAMGPSGPNMSDLERLMRTRPVKAIYTMPSLHNPMGWVMGAAARARLVALARQHDALIIEDGTYSFLLADAPTPVRELAPERTVYVSGLSKTLGGGVRFGFVVSPPKHMVALERTLRALTWSNSTLVTALCGRWLEDGTVNRMELERRADAAARQRIAQEELAGLHMIRNTASYFVWLMLPAEVRADQLAGLLMRQGILVATSQAFAAAASFPHAIRLSLGGIDLPALRDALKRVRREIEHYPI